MDADDVTGERRERGGSKHHGDHRSGRHPVAFGVVDRGEGIAVGLLLAEVGTNCFRVTIARKGAIGTSGIGDTVHPIPAVTLRQQPAAERDLRPIIFILVSHVQGSIVRRRLPSIECSCNVLANRLVIGVAIAGPRRLDSNRSLSMERDLQLRAAARAIYEACYPTEEWAPCGFEEAERFGTVHYRQVLGATQEARLALTADERQLLLSVVL
jgi:hypothetical protein